MALKFDRWPWKKNRAPLQKYIKLCASFQIHWWNQTGVTVWKRSIRVKIGDFLSRVTLKFDGWLWEIIGHLFYVASSFVHHFKAISVFNLSYSLEMLNSGQNQRFFVPCDLEIWWMTLKSHRAPLLCYFKLCASFHSHQRNQAGVYSPEMLNSGQNLWYFCPVKFDGWPWKIIGNLFYTTPSFVHHFKAINEFKLELQSRNTQFGSKSAFFVPCDLEIRWMTLKNNRAPLLSNINLCASFHH